MSGSNRARVILGANPARPAIVAPGATRKRPSIEFYADLFDMIRMPDVTAPIESAGFEIASPAPAQCAQYIDSELKK